MTIPSDVEVLRLSAKQAAAFVGVGYRQFYNLLKGSYPPPRTGKNTFPSDELGKWLIARALRENTVVNGDGERLDPTQENARKNKELADKTALENQVRRGELVEVDAVVNAGLNMANLVKTRMLRLPSKTAPLVAGETDFAVVQQTLDDAVTEALEELTIDWTMEIDDDSE